ncbi:MAG TPA: 1,4-alpha-glucan branching protein domain-containing protein [Gemmatimonadales bacterium]|nr:1,4-alpha-glucan branching protein domain-containing protein [Gemmatimonadales bacterium]
MDFVLALHSHLPYVLNHGRWPHGSDWLCEAALDTYLPLIDVLQGLARDDIAAPITIGFTPVLANQLTSSTFADEMEAFFGQRLAACEEAPASLAGTGDSHLLPLVGYWRSRFCRLQTLFHDLDRDITAAFRSLEQQGRLEIIGSAATHGYTPLLGRDESIRLQFAVGAREHRRIFGRAPVGCWLPECAYRPHGRWTAGGPERARPRPGTEEFLQAAGFRYFFTDAHLAHAGSALGTYAEVPLGAERFDAERHEEPASPGGSAERSPYRPYRIASTRKPSSVAALVRDPLSSMRIWSRHHGYPGDEWYLEFHKIRWPGGLRFWRVSTANSDLGAKQQYDPGQAERKAIDHAAHFAHLVSTLPVTRADGVGVVTAPFDTELFGHWWFEGVDFLGAVYRSLAAQRGTGVKPVTGSTALRDDPATTRLRLAEGSWGANGDHSMWMNDRTAWTWQRLWPLEDAFWSTARELLNVAAARPALAQAARELLLAQASDWQFIISTGVVADYGERRFRGHCHDAEQLIALLAGSTRDPSALETANARAEELARRDNVFPDILESVAAVLHD